MSITFQCNCGKAFRVDDKYAGRSTKCPSCGVRLIVPARGPIRSADNHTAITGSDSRRAPKDVSDEQVEKWVGVPAQESRNEPSIVARVARATEAVSAAAPCRPDALQSESAAAVSRSTEAEAPSAPSADDFPEIPGAAFVQHPLGVVGSVAAVVGSVLGAALGAMFAVLVAVVVATLVAAAISAVVMLAATAFPAAQAVLRTLLGVPFTSILAAAMATFVVVFLPLVGLLWVVGLPVCAGSLAGVHGVTGAQVVGTRSPRPEAAIASIVAALFVVALIALDRAASLSAFRALTLVTYVYWVATTPVVGWLSAKWSSEQAEWCERCVRALRAAQRIGNITTSRWDQVRSMVEAHQFSEALSGSRMSGEIELTWRACWKCRNGALEAWLVSLEGRRVRRILRVASSTADYTTLTELARRRRTEQRAREKALSKELWNGAVNSQAQR